MNAPRTFDITPKWEPLVPLLVEVAARGTTAEAQQMAMEELKRMARAVDAMNAAEKAP